MKCIYFNATLIIQIDMFRISGRLNYLAFGSGPLSSHWIGVSSLMPLCEIAVVICLQSKSHLLCNSDQYQFQDTSNCILYIFCFLGKSSISFVLASRWQVLAERDWGWTSLIILEPNFYQLLGLDLGLALRLEQHSYQNIIAGHSGC